MDELSQGPVAAVPNETLALLDDSPGRMTPIPGSRMFEIREALAVFREKNDGRREFDASQGDGGASLSGVPLSVLQEAHRLQCDHGTGYDKPFGTEMFRRAVVEDYWALDSGTGWGPSNVIACQGGRDALLKIYDAVQFLGHGRRGDFIVVSRVPWISYNWGPYAVGSNVLLAPGSDTEAWALTPDGIRACVEAADRHGGRRIGAVIVTSPDNPTGRSMRLDEQADLGRTAFEAGIPFVVFDWIYHRVEEGRGYDLNRFLSLFDPEQRDRCIILDGITKSLGGSNIRNAHVLASEAVVRFMAGRASHGVIPSFHSQAVAVAAYRMGFERAAATIVEPTNRSRTILRRMLENAGVRHVIGQGYYAFIDVGAAVDRLGLGDSADLGTMLAEESGIAVVPGVFFSPYGSRWIRFSYAQAPADTEGAGRRLLDVLEAR